MSKKLRDRSRIADFSHPRWPDHAGGLAAAVWTRWDAPWFGGPFDRADDLRLWLVREAAGRPILACFRPRVDPAAGVVAIADDGIRGAWDLAARDGSPADVRADDAPLAGLARQVADLVVRQWPSASHSPPPVPATYLAYPGRIPIRRTAEFAERLARASGDDPTPARRAWQEVPTRFRAPDGSLRFLYPAALVAADSPRGYPFHPETLDPAPDLDAETSPGWIRTGSVWAPHVPLGGAMIYAATGRLAGLESMNPAFAVYKEHGLLGTRDGLGDRGRLDAAAARLADDREFSPRDRLDLCAALRKRLSRRVKYTPADLMAGLLQPHRPIVASTHPRLASFAESELAGLDRRGWDLRGLAALTAAATSLADELEPVAV